MSETVIPFPRAFRPHSISDHEALLFGDGGAENVTPYGETLQDFTARPHFGLRPATGEAIFNIPRADDRVQQEAFKAKGGEDRVRRAALSAAEQYALGSRAHIHPDMDKALAAQIEHWARIGENLAREARALGWPRQSVTLGDISAIAETVSNEILIPHTPESA